MPGLSNNPASAITGLCKQVESLRLGDVRIGLIGSSLGGFYASFLAERFDLRAVQVNPAIQPYDLLERYRGENQNPYTGEQFTVDEQFVRSLRDIEVTPSPERYLLLTQTGDETLDFQRGVDWYKGCEQIVEQGGDHAFQGFERHLPKIMDFLAL